MKHEHIAEQAFIERYLRGDLPADDEARFEDHFMGCATCQQQLKLARSFQQGMRAMAAEDAVRQVVTGGLFAWLLRRGRGVQAGLAMAVLLVALVPALWLLVGPRQPASDVGGVVSPSVLLLNTYRDETGEPTVVLDLSSAAASVVLAVDVGDDARFVSYHVALDDATGTTLLRRDGLRLSALEVLMISFPADFLPPGDYRLRVVGVMGDGSTVDLGAHSFRVVADAP